MVYNLRIPCIHRVLKLCSGALWQEHLNLPKFLFGPVRSGRVGQKMLCKVLIASAYNYLGIHAWCLIFSLMIFSFPWALPVLESITCSISSKQRPTIHLPSLQSFNPAGKLFTFAVLLLMFHHHYYHHHYHFHTTVSQLLLIPSCKQVLISGALELKTQLSKPVRILWLPKCRINKLGYLALEDYLDPL